MDFLSGEDPALGVPAIGDMQDVQELEDDTQKPVVSSTAASLWWVVHALGMKAPVEGYGKLLRN